MASVRRRNRRGVALIIVLVLVALLTGILVVFLSRSITDRQIAGSSAAETRTRLLAEGAVDTLLSDLKQEIAAGSNAQVVTAGSTTTTLYPPKTPVTMVPAAVGTTGTAGTENLLKRSAYNQPFYGSAYDTGNYPPSNRAAHVSSLAVSLNGRLVSPARWNEHLLLEKNSALTTGDANDSDFTPVGASATAWTGAPDWVLVTRDGSAQTTWSSGLVAQNGNNGAVTGRYAYQIFEEGGLLDVNAAGYPSTAPPAGSPQASLPSYKASAAFADLTQLPGIGDLSPTRQNALRDALVGWRNYASAQPVAASTFPSYTFNASTIGSYYLFASNHPKGFLATGNATLYNDQSDRLFSSRQELFKLLLGGFASTDPSSTGKQERASLQNSLRFLTHFSRALEQPAYIPDPNRPKVVDQDSSANGSDDGINPSFPAVRVTHTLARGRNDGSDLTVGDPLVKKRFALNRLAWLTYLGPSANNMGSAIVQATIKALGGDPANTNDPIYQFVAQGTAQNIYNYFGLSWVADARTTPKGDGQSKWVYSHTGTTVLTSLPTGGPILRVGRPPSVTAPDSTRYVQDLNPGREADFFELLKAAVACGSKAKTATTTPTNPSATTDAGSPTFYANQDSSYELAVIQMGANIIDQFDLDGYATRILFNDGNLLPKEVRGVEDLPYLYRVRYGLVQGRAPVVVSSPAPATANNPVIQDTGFNVLYEQPEVWNPHDQNSPAADPSVPSLMPTSFRCVAYSTDPDHIDNSSDASTTYLSMLCNERMASCNSAPIYYNGYASPEICDASTPVAAPFSKAYNSPSAFSTGTSSGAFALSPDNAALFFNIPAGTPGAAFFREPTLLVTPNVPMGSNLSALPPANASGSAKNMLNPGASIGATIPSNHPNIKPYLDSGNGALKSVADGKEYLGFYMTTMPADWYVPAQNVVSPSKAYPGKALAINRNLSPGGSNNVLFIKHQSSPTLAVTYRLQYQQDPVSDKWVSYDEKYASLVPGSTSSAEATTTGWSGYGNQSANAFDGSTGRNYPCAYDPRTSRFGMPYVPNGGSPATLSNADSPPTSATVYGWILQLANQLVTQRPDYSSGFFNAGLSTLPTAPGWTNTAAQVDFGLLTQNNSLFSGNGKRWATDPGASASIAAQSYADPDSVTRRGMGAYVAGTNVVGLPMATGAGTSQAQSRPIVLNRPFRTVGELGYVFSGTPWKNLDFFTADSGDAALLDVFTINDPDDVGGMVAGRVNLNTRQAPVLQAILAAAYKDEQAASATPPSWQAQGLTSNARGEASKITAALMARTASTNPGQGPLTNAAELVGRYGNVSANGTITSRYDNQKFDGFANDLTTDVNGNAVFGENTPTSNIQRLREAPVRALSAAGQTRVWNLLLDVIAQTGRYPLTASKLENFVVEGEQHYWVHVAIDRLTGNVIDKQIEVVKE